MASILLTEHCQCKQAPSVTGSLCWSVVRGAWGVHLGRLVLCNFIPQYCQQQHIWIISLSLSSFLLTASDNEDVPRALEIHFFQRHRNLKKKKKESSFLLQRSLGLLFRVIALHSSLSWMKVEQSSSLWLCKRGKEMMSAPSWDHCNPATKWCNCFLTKMWTI